MQYGYRDEEVDREWAERTLAIVDKNYKHWECFYALAFFSDPIGVDVLRPLGVEAVRVLVKFLSWHCRGGQRCEGRLCTERLHEDNEEPEKEPFRTEEEKRREALVREERKRKEQEKRRKNRMAPPKKRPNLRREVSERKTECLNDAV